MRKKSLSDRIYNFIYIIRKKINDTFLGIIFIVFFFFIVYWQYNKEKIVDRNITYYDVLEDSILVILGEYPDKPHSMPARIFRLMLFVSGVFLFGVIVAKISSLMIIRELLGVNKMKSFKNHIIMCNWNNNAIHILKQLRELTKTHKCNVVILTDLDEAKQEMIKKECENGLFEIFFDRLDPTHHENLAKVNIQYARSIILLADNACEDPDAKNALIALAIRYFKKDNNDIQVVAEVNNPNMRDNLLKAGVNELVCNNNITGGIIAQSALSEGMSNVYERLLDCNDMTNEIYFVEKYPDELQLCKSFKELSAKVAEYAKGDSPFILLGIKYMKYNNSERILLNPKANDFQPISKVNKDKLIVMAYSKIDEIL